MHQLFRGEMGKARENLCLVSPDLKRLRADHLLEDRRELLLESTFI